jgi:hypothetical protein
MLKICRTLFTLAATVMLFGCATVPDGPMYPASSATSQPSDKSVVYVYRRYAEPTAWGATIKLAEREVATLGQGTFTWAYVTPGKQVVRATWPGLSGQKDSTIEAELVGGKTYYFELVGISRVTGAAGSLLFVRMGSGLNEVAPSAAETALSQCCRFQKPSNQDY